VDAEGCRKNGTERAVVITTTNDDDDKEKSMRIVMSHSLYGVLKHYMITSFRLGIPRPASTLPSARLASFFSDDRVMMPPAVSLA